MLPAELHSTVVARKELARIHCSQRTSLDGHGVHRQARRLPTFTISPQQNLGVPLGHCGSHGLRSCHRLRSGQRPCSSHGHSSGLGFRTCLGRCSGHGHSSRLCQLQQGLRSSAVTASAAAALASTKGGHGLCCRTGLKRSAQPRTRQTFARPHLPPSPEPLPRRAFGAVALPQPHSSSHLRATWRRRREDTGGAIRGNTVDCSAAKRRRILVSGDRGRPAEGKFGLAYS